jgi:hypothetical protein
MPRATKILWVDFELGCYHNLEEAKRLWPAVSRYPAFVEKAKSDTFVAMCGGGQLFSAQWLNSVMVVEPENKTRAFQSACIMGHDDVVQWLVGLGGVDVHVHNDLPFRNACKDQGAIAKFLHSLGGVDIHAEEDAAFVNACSGGCIDIAQWLHSLGGVDIHAQKDNAFVLACTRQDLDVAKWLHSLDTGAEWHLDNAFDLAAAYDNREGLQWLCTVGSISRKGWEEALFDANENEFMETVRWLLARSPFPLSPSLPPLPTQNLHQSGGSGEFNGGVVCVRMMK